MRFDGFAQRISPSSPTELMMGSENKDLGRSLRDGLVGLRPEPASSLGHSATIPNAAGVMASGWASPVLAAAYHKIEALRDELAQPVESGISEALKRALDAIEDADCELERFK